MKSILLIIVLSAVSASSYAIDSTSKSKLTSDRSERAADKRSLVLTTGEDKIVDLDFDAYVGPKGIDVGNPKILVPQLVKVGDKRQIVFKPLLSGETTVTVRDNEGNLRVIFDVRINATDLLTMASQIRELLKDIEGIEIRIVGRKVIVDGEVLVPQDYGRLVSVISDKAFSGSVLNLTTLSGIALQLLSKKIQEDVVAFAPNVKTRVVNGQVWLEGTVDNFDQARRAQTVAKLYLPELKPGDALEKDPTVQRLPPRSLVQNFLVINPPPPKKQDKLVRITVHFVELSKDFNDLFGFKWQPGFTKDTRINIGQNAEGAAGASGTSFTATISSLFPKLQSAQNAGFARILKSGTLVVRSGQPAKLSDQTQIPYTMITSNGLATTATAAVGLQVSVTPQILGQSQDIELDLNMDQIALTGRTEGQNAPITSSHKVETKIYLESSESAAVAGVEQSSVTTEFNKDDPSQGTFGGDTDPLFTLLRSKNYTKKKGQFVIFVTPEILNNASEGTDDLKKNFRVKVN